MTINELLRKTSLKKHEAEEVICDILDVDKTKLFLEVHQELNEDDLNRFKKIETKLLKGYPLQYALNKAYFFNCEFFVDERVLIPRPETEILTEWSINFLKESNIINPKVLEIGTGSGCISIAIAKNTTAMITAVDISQKALEVSKVNAKLNKAKNISFLKSNLFNKVEGKFDLIVANLPYLTKEETSKVPHEPSVALYGYENGFELIEKAIRSLPLYLNSKGKAIFEVSHHQGPLLNKICNEKNIKLEFINDLTGRLRFFVFSNDKGKH